MRPRPDDVKTARLCRRMEEALSLAIAGRGDRAPLNVSPRVVAALGRARGRPRNEVVEAILRKRVPELIFRLAPPET